MTTQWQKNHPFRLPEVLYIYMYMYVVAIPTPLMIMQHLSTRVTL